MAEDLSAIPGFDPATAEFFPGQLGLPVSRTAPEVDIATTIVTLLGSAVRMSLKTGTVTQAAKLEKVSAKAAIPDELAAAQKSFAQAAGSAGRSRAITNTEELMSYAKGMGAPITKQQANKFMFEMKTAAKGGVTAPKLGSLLTKSLLIGIPTAVAFGIISYMQGQAVTLQQASESAGDIPGINANIIRDRYNWDPAYTQEQAKQDAEKLKVFISQAKDVVEAQRTLAGIPNPWAEVQAQAGGKIKIEGGEMSMKFLDEFLNQTPKENTPGWKKESDIGDMRELRYTSAVSSGDFLKEKMNTEGLSMAQAQAKYRNQLAAMQQQKVGSQVQLAERYREQGMTGEQPIVQAETDTRDAMIKEKIQRLGSSANVPSALTWEERRRAREMGWII